MIQNKLAEFTNSIGLEEAKQDAIQKAFAPFQDVVAQWKERAFALVVTSEDQTELMDEAKEARKIIRDKRLDLEKKRKALKDSSLQEGRLIDGVARILKDSIGPIESHLLEQEKFAEVAQAKREKERAEMRIKTLESLGADPSIFDLGNMTDDQFEDVVTNAKVIKEQRERAEAQRIADEEAEALRIKQKQEAQAKKQADERAQIEAMRQARMKEMQDERDRLAKENAELEKQRKADRSKRDAEDRKRRAVESERAEQDRLRVEAQRKLEAQNAELQKDILAKQNSSAINILFSGEDPNLMFVEIKNDNGNGVNVGEWSTKDGFQVLRIENVL